MFRLDYASAKTSIYKYKLKANKKQSLHKKTLNYGNNIFKYITFFLFVVSLLAMTNSVYALDQLHGITETGWNSYRIGGAITWYYSQGNYYRPLATQNNSSGFRYHTLTIPGNVNARFSWVYSPYNTQNRAYEVSFRYGTRNNQTNGDVSVFTYNSTTSNTNQLSGNAEREMTAGTYYAKCYFSGSNQATAYFYSYQCNISPYNLAANLQTVNRNIGGTNCTFINGVNLTWGASTSDVVTLNNYNVYRSTTSGSSYVKIAEVPAGTTSFLDIPNNPGTYYYVVTDVDTNGTESPYSRQVSITSPGKITGLAAEVITPWEESNTFIRLGCNPSPNNAEIYFFRGTSSGNYNFSESWGGNTSVDDNNGLTDNTVYYYAASYIYQYSPVRYSPLSEEISVYFLKPPLGLAAQYNYDFVNMKDQIRVSWNAKAVANLQGYTIYRSSSENGVYNEIGTVDSSTTSFYDGNVIPGNTYYYKITCTTTLGSSGLSKAVSAYVSKPPTNLTANMVSATRVNLTWTAPNPTNTNHNGFYIYRSLTKNGPFTQVGQVWVPTTNYSDTSINIQDGDCYYYVVADFDYSNNVISGYSNVAKASKLFPPTNLTATLNGTTVTLNWNASSCPLAKLGGYYIYRGESAGGPYTLLGSVEGNTLTYDDTTAPENATSYYVVTTYNREGGESDESNEANCFVPSAVDYTVTIDSSVAPEIVLDNTDVADIPVNWVVNSSIAGVTIDRFIVTIYKSDGTPVQSSSTTNTGATSHTVTNVILRNGQSYYASLEVFYTINGYNKSAVFLSTNSFTAVTPQTMNVIDGWSGKDISYSFFDNRVEACWSHDANAAVVKYEVAVGTIPYGTDLVDWQEIGLSNRVALTTSELASGTRYFTSVRGITQKKNIALIGCSDGFVARKDPVTKDTDALNFFNNARVLENLSTENGKLTPVGEIANGNWKYYRPITITEPGVTDRVNAPCLVDFAIPAAQRPGDIREFRVVDDQGNVVPRYNLTTPNNSTVNHPYIVFLVNMRKNETRTYYVYWGNNTAADPNYGFVNNTDKNSLSGWTPYYTRNDTPAGMEDVALSTKFNFTNLDDGGVTENLTSFSKFYFYGTNYKTTSWYLSVNAYFSTNAVTGGESYRNTFAKFTGSSGTILGKCIVPIWVDHMTGTAWSESGVFRDIADNPKRIIYTWITYRFGVTDDAYKFQAVLYETGDIAIRYGLINPRALISNGSYDKAVNTSAEHTVGISNGDGTRYMYHTPLLVGINQNPTAFYQCMNAFDDTKVYGDIVGNGTEYSVARFESMVFDTRIASPKWTCLQYDAAVTGSRKIELFYRTGNSPLPDNSWTAWSEPISISESITNGEVPVTTSGRYIQYKAEFFKTGTNGSMELNEVRFIYGGISIQNVCSVIDGEPVTEVTQGQTNIPLTVTIKNECSEAVSLAVATLTFTLNGHSAVLTEPNLPFNIAAGELATLTYSVNIAENATTGECTIDALATVSALIYDDGAQNPLTWTVKSKAGLVIDNVYSEYTKVTKGYSYNLFITLTNTGETDCILNSIWPTYASGTYTFTFDPTYGLATGTYPGGGANTIIHGNETKTAKFIVEISSESSSGSDTLGAVASATNILSGETFEILTTDNPHIWTIQTPAELNLYDIIASSTLYRGQKNNNIILMATNEGEAELEWYPGSSTQYINFAVVTGLAKSYENKKMVTEEPVINITSDSIVQARYSVDIKQDTATGTDRITAKLFGKELNTGVPLDYTENLPFTEWTIYSERVNTFADGAYMEEKDSFNLPSGAGTVTVYAKVENLAANVEYIVHWIAPDGTEIETTTPIITSGQGYFGCWYDFDSTSQSGIYKIRVTDSLNIYTCCENTFEVVAPADIDALFELPQYVTVNQPFVGSFTFINRGGAVIANATLVPTDTVDITQTGGGAVDFTPDDTEALFSPRLLDVPGYGQATTTFKLRATHTGTVRLTTSATGFDNNSGLTLSKPNVQSNICTIQNPPNIQITNITKTSNTVFKNQKNLRVTATLRNNGQATAVITAASITFNIGTYEQELIGFPDGLEIELTQNQEIPITFDVGVDVDSASGLDTLTVNAVWYDKNWPQDKVSSNSTTWTIAACGIILSANPNFDYEQDDYVRGQTVYVRAYGVAPNTQYYRIRFYNSQIAQANTVPSTGYMTTDQGYSGLLASNDDGYVEHIYKLPDAATIGTWSVTLESAASINSTYQNYGTMLALQYFRVQNTPHMYAEIHAENVSIENNDKIFVGDTFRVTMTVTSTTGDNVSTPAANTGAIDFIEPYSLVKNNGAQGNVELVSGPDPATFTLRAGESKTFEYVYRATEFTGNGKFSFKSSNTYAAKGRDRNLWDHNEDTPYDIFARQQTTSNQIDIYIKSMEVSPSNLEFGHTSMFTQDYPQVGLICGESQELNLNLVKTGNYNVENIRLNAAALNGPIGLDGLRKSISSTYLNIDVASFSNPLTKNSETTKVSLTIPYNQPKGEYVSTMFLYSDANNNGIFDSGEVTADFNLKVYVNDCKVIKVNDKLVDAGGWSRGTTTSNFEVNYFNAGNLNLSKVKIIPFDPANPLNPPASLTPHIHFSTPTEVGAISVGEFKKVIFNATIPVDADLGTYIATYTIFEDNDENGSCNPSASPHNPEPYDTFQVHMTIGQLAFEITPTAITASPVETSFTAQTGVYPTGFSQLTIRNNSTNGMPLTRIKMMADTFDGVDKNNNHYPMASNTVAIYPGSLKQPLESGETDLFDIEVYIAPGTHCATYTTTLHFFSDDNDNNLIDTGETKFDVLLKVYVKPTEKVKVIDKPVSVTGMSSDVQDTYAECEFLCYNLGNVDLSHLKFDMHDLVQKDVPAPDIIYASQATFSFVGSNPFTAPLNSEFSSKVTIKVPKFTKDGVYITTVLCRIYNDTNEDGSWTEGECFDEFQIWLQIGEMKIVIVNPHDVHGEPSERSTEGAFTVKNDGALTVTSVNATATSFIKGDDVIPATASVFLPSNKVGTLKPGFQRSLNWAVDIPDCTPAGVYTGKIVAWSDTDGNEQIGVAEASASADVKITVDACPKLSIRSDNLIPADIDEFFTPFVMNNSTVRSCFRIYNTGNMPIADPGSMPTTSQIQIERNNLSFMTNFITTDDFSIDIDSVYPIQPGEYRLATVTVRLGDTHLVNGHYRGEQTFFVKLGDTVLCSDKVTLDVEFGKKELTVSPDPLIFDLVDYPDDTQKTVTATRVPPAGLKHIYVYEKSHCDRNEPYCNLATITCLTSLPVDVVTSKDFTFEIEVDPRTPPGWHIATWTFFDDGDGDGNYDEGEYFVDFQIHYRIPEMNRVLIEPSRIEVVDVAPAETKPLSYTITNIGNTSIDFGDPTFSWSFTSGFVESESGALFNLNNMPISGFYVASAPTGILGMGQSADILITLTAPAEQELGLYNEGGPAITQTMSYKGEYFYTNIDKILVLRRGPVTPEDTVYQVVASDTFDLVVNDGVPTPQTYFISAWICPGIQDPANLSAANLSVLRCDKEGKPKAALSVRLNNNELGKLYDNQTTAGYKLYKDEYENVGPGDPGAATFSFVLRNDGSPICGISGDPITAKDDNDPDPNNRLTFYRVYFAFTVGESIATDSMGLSIDPENQDKIVILLTQGVDEGNTSPTEVYFDGVKLEKALFEGQDRPTTYHKDTTLVSPSTGLDVSGKHKFYEW